MEIEIKCIIPDKKTCERLQKIDQLAGFLLSAGHDQDLYDTYLDTADRDLQKAGYICRKRQQADTAVISLKQLIKPEGSVHRREEFQISLSSVDLEPDQWPDSQTRSLVLEFSQHKPLVPLCELRQKRFIRKVRSQGERLVAELCIDEVHLTTGADEHTYYEVEAELLAEGTESDLEKIQACLHHEWGLAPQILTKFERALELIEGAPASPSCTDSHLLPSPRADESSRKLSITTDRPNQPGSPAQKSAVLGRAVSATPQNQLEMTPDTHRSRTSSKKPGISIDDTMAEAARKTLYFHFKRMVNHEAGTRRGEDIEALHDMRVATRRMRAAIRVCGKYLDRKQIKPFAKQVRRTGRILGTVRDLDVFKQKAQAYLDTLPPHRQDELDPLFMVYNRQYQNARQRLLDFLNSPRYVRFKKEFEKFLKQPGAAALPACNRKEEPVPQRLRHVLPIVLHQRLAAVRAYEDYLYRRDMSLERLHRLRIAFKGLRYTLEFFKEVIPQDAEPLIEELKRLQDHLGNIQDAVVTSAILRNFLTWGTWGPVTSAAATMQGKPVIAPGVAAYLSVRQAELQRLLETFTDEWERLEQIEFFKRTAALVHGL